MQRDLATTAELVKLARALGTAPDAVTFANYLAPEDIRALRERVVGALYDEHRAAFKRVATITRLLPTPVNVRIALRAFPPLLAARVAGEMAPERAAEMADRMPIGYLAECCLHLDPRRAAPLVHRVRPDRAVAVVLELVERGEFVALGPLLDAATERIVQDVAMKVSDEALLRIGCYAESAALTHAVAMLPTERLRDIVHTAVEGGPDLRAAGLVLIGRLADDGLRGRLAGYAAEAGDEVLTRLLGTAIDEGALPELLAAVTAMDAGARQRVLALPALADPELLAHLLGSTPADELRHPLVAELTDDLRRRIAGNQPG